jgi:multiple sugar transport system ATP-binding protein
VVLEELGSDAHVFFHVDAPRITPEVLEAEGEDDDQLVAEPNALLNARVDPRTTARIGAPLRLAVDPARFHFFDPETGASLLERGIPQVPDPVPIAP